VQVEASKSALYTPLKLFAILLAAAFILRIFYSRNLYEDDGLWLTAAEELLRGKALYREIYFDKPPILPMVYALLFKTFGTHLLVIRLFSILYAAATAALLYAFGSRLYDRRAGLLAAVLFTIFSSQSSGHTQALNTDFLMTLPYTAGAFLFVLSRIRTDRQPYFWYSLGGGILSGVAFQINPKGIFNLLFYGLLIFVWFRWQTTGSRKLWRDGLKALLIAMAGFVAGCAPFIAYVAAVRSLTMYWTYVWVWGTRYAEYYPLTTLIEHGARLYVGYFALSNLLLITLVVVVWHWAKTVLARRAGRIEYLDGNSSLPSLFRSDTSLLIWFGVSMVGMCMGARFFLHYFFQILPALCLIGGRGLTLISNALKRPADESRKLWLRRAFVGLMIAGFAVTLVRFHARTVVLAADWVRGKESAYTAEWFHQELNREERMVAANIRGMPDGPDEVERAGVDAFRASGPRTGGPADYLFVWGYRPEIYYWTGLLPASRYLSVQPLTGVPADVEDVNGENRSVLDETAKAAARAQLIEDLSETQPLYIVDQVGMFNSELAINNYPELREFMQGYKPRGAVGLFMVYRKREKKEKDRE
jgi:4-amino-4-deoxy-L-arabinose transferase-like glycosyltransferase